MNLYNNQRKISTWLKYFISYVLICTVLLVGVWFIVKNQMRNLYLEQRVDNLKIQLDNIAGWINENLLYLSQTDSSLVNNNIIIRNHYLKQDVNNNEIMVELKKYDASSKIINGIVYMSKKTMHPLSTSFYVTWEEDKFCIGSGNNTIILDMETWLEQDSRRLLFVSDEKVMQLLYLPDISPRSNQLFFYILDINEIKFQIRTLVSNEIQSVALVDRKGRIVISEGDDYWYQGLKIQMLESGIFRLDDNNFLCISQEIEDEYFLVAIFSHEVLMKQINESIVGVYISLVLLGGISLVLIVVAMNITYIPLFRLAQKYAPNSSWRSSHLNQLENIYTEIVFQNQDLDRKLYDYRSYMQKILLKFIVDSNTKNELLPKLDGFFDNSINRKIFIVYLCTMNDTLSNCNVEVKEKSTFRYSSGIVLGNDFKKYIGQVILNDEDCIVLEHEENKVLLLINFRGIEEDIIARIMELLPLFCETRGCFSAISQDTNSPMDIPALYKNVKKASLLWPQIMVADGRTVAFPKCYVYPKKELNELSVRLSECNFVEVESLVEELFGLMNTVNIEIDELKTIYIHGVLNDMLMNVLNVINQFKIEFDDYKEIYYENLSYCRDVNHLVDLNEVKKCFTNLLQFFEKTIKSRQLKSAPIREILEERYCHPEFSIAELAEAFQVSVSCMSYQFKHEFNMTFSDYLWWLRVNKAKELLSTTKMTVEEVSLAVGYYSASGFMRKFKQETGMTPSQFRMRIKGESSGEEI